MPNRLANSKSPYLRQHAENPVDWYPWGEEAFARAKTEGKPVLLSVGYSACHWCHVMAHESFEDAGIAEILNAHFISVKVDREERPDVDDAYMTAVQLSSGRGGWPMTVFMTPEKKPFFAGTYFPKEDRGGHPGFRSLVTQIATAWKDARVEVDHAAHEFASALAQTIERDAPAGTLAPDLIEHAIAALRDDFDEVHGGFGFAPKFPPHSALELLLATGHKEMAEKTLESMVRGGIHDHVGGGFHRYSTDEEWLLPHFEKMLYDNALILHSLCESEFHVAIDRLIQWIEREMTSPEGLFYSALDADSEGEEGKFYVWSHEELVRLEGVEFCQAYDVRPEGNFRDEATGRPTGTNIPNRIRREGMTDADLVFPHLFITKMDGLREVRDRRPHPGLDDKVIVGWNALMITALVKAGRLDMAERAATEILRHDPLPRIVGSGDSAFLEDCASMAMACHALDLARRPLRDGESTIRFGGDDELGVGPIDLPIADSEFGGETPRDWKAEADRLVDLMMERFAAPEGGFFASSTGHESLFGRSIPITDSPIPSANSLALRALMRTDPKHPHLEKSFRRLAGWMERAPTACEGLVLAYWEYLQTSAREMTGAPRWRRDRRRARPPFSSGQVVTVDLEADSVRVLNGRIHGTVVLTIADGYHIQSPGSSGEMGQPIQVEMPRDDFHAEYPPAAGGRYVGSVSIPFSYPALHRSSKLSVTYHVCTETECYAPTVRGLMVQVAL